MTARARVVENFAIDGVDVYLGRTIDGGRMILFSADGTSNVIDRQMSPQGEPTIRLQEDVARVLMEELLKHFGYAGDLASLRLDYEAERRRCDRLIEMLGTQLELKRLGIDPNL